MFATFSRSSAGRMRQRMSLRFRSTAWFASLPSIHVNLCLVSATEHAPRRVHHRREVRHARAKLSLHVLLPAHCSRLPLCMITRGLSDDSNAALERRTRRPLRVAPAEDTIQRFRVERVEVREEVAEGPAWVRRFRRRVQERDSALFWWDIREERLVLLDGREFGLIGVSFRADEEECAGRGEEGVFDGGELRWCRTE